MPSPDAVSGENCAITSIRTFACSLLFATHAGGAACTTTATSSRTNTMTMRRMARFLVGVSLGVLRERRELFELTLARLHQARRAAGGQVGQLAGMDVREHEVAALVLRIAARTNLRRRGVVARAFLPGALEDRAGLELDPVPAEGPRSDHHWRARGSSDL